MTTSLEGPWLDDLAALKILEDVAFDVSSREGADILDGAHAYICSNMLKSLNLMEEEDV